MSPVDSGLATFEAAFAADGDSTVAVVICVSVGRTTASGSVATTGRPLDADFPASRFFKKFSKAFAKTSYSGQVQASIRLGCFVVIFSRISLAFGLSEAITGRDLGLMKILVSGNLRPSADILLDFSAGVNSTLISLPLFKSIISE